MTLRIRTYLRKDEKFQAPAKALLDGILGGLKFEADVYPIFDVCDQEISRVVRGCRAVGILGKKVCVHVPSAAHRQDLLYSKKRIVDRINQVLGRKAIIDLQFELGTKE